MKGQLRDQMLGRYTAPEARRVGCLLNRQWQHPDGGHLIGIEEVVKLLQEEVKALSIRLDYDSLLDVRALDLRPRKFAHRVK